MKTRAASIILAAFLSAVLPLYGRTVVVGREGNLFSTQLASSGENVKTVTTVAEAIKAARKGSGVIVTAPSYPSEQAAITASDYAAFAAKKIRLFVEYPAVLPDGKTPEIFTAGLERGVVVGSIPGIKPLGILGINGCKAVRAEASAPIAVIGKVAGFDDAVFGIDDVETLPLLYESGGVLVATTSFSNAFVGRYGPSDHWKAVTDWIIGWILAKPSFCSAFFPMDPYPAYTKDQDLPLDAKKKAVVKAADWLWGANLFIDASWEKKMMNFYWEQRKLNNPFPYFGPAITASMLQGDGSRGIMEGHASSIDAAGGQTYRYFLRADVQGETPFLLSAAGKLSSDPKYDAYAARMLDYLFETSMFRTGCYNDKSSPNYGMIGWCHTKPEVLYNDDNARCVLGAIGASALMGNQKWNRYIVENILVNLRVASTQGFVEGHITSRLLEKNGLDYYSERPDFVFASPHYGAWMWAAYLWLYDKTGYEPLLTKAKAAISYMMKVYPDWKTQNGMQQERARMILPLAWLVRVEDTPQTRAWLDTAVSNFLEFQEDCGAIREQMGSREQDHKKMNVYSNAEYGKGEAPLIARNGEKVADMLYTVNFGFFALNEAFAATGNPKYREAVEKMADFLVRIQARSFAHPDLDGAWFRVFDYGRWEYWASNSDFGWGPWCTLCGWIQTWIGATEYMVDSSTNYWDITRGLDMKEAFAQSRWIMER